MGVAGLGQGAAGMIPSMAVMPEIELVAGADINPAMRAGFAERFPGTRVYETVAALCDDPNVEAIYVGTPNRFHCEHALEAMQRGKHVVVEKPMAIDLDEADRMVEAAAKHRVKLLAAHTRSYSIWNRAMRKLTLSGALGPVRAIHVWAYTDWMLRPRTADELDPNQGGGIVFRQGPHQIDTVRLLGGGMLRSVRAMTGQWMAERPVPGYYCAYFEFEDGTPATIMHNGYGYYSMNELYPWVTSKRDYTDEQRAQLRRELRSGIRDEDKEKEEFRVGGRRDPTAAAKGAGGPQEWSPFDLGPVELTCERGFIRNAQRGLVVYDDGGRHDVDLRHLWRPEPDPSGGLSLAVLEELYAAVVLGRPVFHGPEWGRATLEAVLAVITSAREQREIRLHRQVAMPRDYDADLQLDAQALVRS
jgi:phthalate 4,5-cis-dihydrodiol dehydrogenase